MLDPLQFAKTNAELATMTIELMIDRDTLRKACERIASPSKQEHDVEDWRHLALLYKQIATDALTEIGRE